MKTLETAMITSYFLILAIFCFGLVLASTKNIFTKMVSVHPSAFNELQNEGERYDSRYSGHRFLNLHFGTRPKLGSLRDVLLLWGY